MSDAASVIKNELQRRQEQAQYYDPTAGAILKPFAKGEPVHIYDIIVRPGNLVQLSMPLRKLVLTLLWIIEQNSSIAAQEHS